jgi:hypothetical protein
MTGEMPRGKPAFSTIIAPQTTMLFATDSIQAEQTQ